MSNGKNLQSSKGSAFVWAIVWLAGMAAIAWATLSFAVPRFEQKLQTTVSNSVASINKSPIIVTVKGHEATLSGQLESEENRQPLIAAAQSAWGVLSVRDQLSNTKESAGSLTPLAQADDTGSDLTAEGAVGLASTETQQEPSSKILLATNAADDSLDSDSSPSVPVEAAKTVSTQSAPVAGDETLGMPSINIRIAGEILAVEGLLSPADDPSQLLQTAMTIFNLDFVSNGIEERDDISPSEWMSSIEQIVSSMGELANPQIDVMEKQITISGVAPNSQVHDSIIGAALSTLGDFSLVERISIDESSANAAKIAKAAEDAQLAADAKVAEEKRLAANAKAAEDELQATEAEAEEEERLAANAKAAEDELQATEAEAEEEERLAANAKAAEDELQATEAEAEEEERLAANAKAAEDELQATEAEAEEEERLAAEAKAAEEQRIAAEAKAAEAERIAAEANAAEEARIAAEANAAEEKRLAAEAKAAEEERIAAEAKAAEEARIAAEAKTAEEARLAAEAKAAEQARIAAEAKAAEEARIAAEAKAAEEARIAAEAKAAEEARLAAEAKAAEEARLAAEAKAAEEARLAAEAKAAEEARLAAEAKAAEEARIAAEAKAAEEARIAAEAKAAEDARLAAAAKAAEEAQLVATAEKAKPVEAAQNDSEDLRKALSALPSLRILFQTSSNVFTAESIDTLNSIAEVLTQFPNTKVSIEGHTDATGARATNSELSLLRATTVRDYLINKGVSVYNLRALGYGEELPIANNRTAEGRAINRRIDFTF